MVELYQCIFSQLISTALWYLFFTLPFFLPSTFHFLHSHTHRVDTVCVCVCAWWVLLSIPFSLNQNRRLFEWLLCSAQTQNMRFSLLEGWWKYIFSTMNEEALRYSFRCHFTISHWVDSITNGWKKRVPFYVNDPNFHH